MINWGAVPAGSVLPFPFTTYGKTNGESITLTGLAVTDIEVYKGTSMTQRSSDNGYALIDTDGIDIDGVTGFHGFSIDTSDNTDAGFYAAGSFYTVLVSTITVDSQTVSFIAGTFRLVAAESTAGTPKADVSMFGGTSGTFSGGRPEVNTTHAAGTAWGSGAITASSIAADAIGASELAADAVTEIAGAVWDITLASHLTGGTTGAALNAAGSAGDPWGTALPGAYTAGSAGYIVGTNINATISSRLASASYTAPLDAAGTRSAVGLASANLDTQLDAIPTANENADALLKRDWTAVTGEAARSVLNALRFLRNKWTISGGTLTVKKEDDSTTAWTGAVTTASSNPVDSIDPS